MTDRRRTPIFILDFRGSPLVARGRASEGLAGVVRARRGGRAGVRGGPGARGTLESGVLEIALGERVGQCQSERGAVLGT